MSCLLQYIDILKNYYDRLQSMLVEGSGGAVDALRDFHKNIEAILPPKSENSALASMYEVVRRENLEKLVECLDKTKQFLEILKVEQERLDGKEIAMVTDLCVKECIQEMHGILTDIGTDIRQYLECPGEFVPAP